jgi:hypothetical protein
VDDEHGISQELVGHDGSHWRRLTFEPSCLRRQALQARAEMMHSVPQPGLAAHAVAGQLERGVRPQWLSSQHA